LSKEQKEKLYGLIDQDNRNKLSKEQEKISLGEQMRSLSSAPATRSLDSGVIETDPAIDEMLMSGQI
jgi:hypothetical protein